MMRKSFLIASFLGLCYFTVHSQHSIIPAPARFVSLSENFQLDEHVGISFENIHELSKAFFHRQLSTFTGFPFPLNIGGRKVLFVKGNTDSLKQSEAYTLFVNKNEIRLIAGTEQGLFYAMQSLFRLYDAERATFKGCEISDEPRYAYRAMHLDVCRHFFGKEVIKQYISLLAALKMNTLHLHLTDDQGWRIEIKKYPLLTDVGAWRTEKDGSRYGGFFTQADLRELVAFASERNVNIIPEIEIPGHSSAAIAAYPFLSCHGKKINIPNTWGIKRDVYCPTDTVIQFLKDVLDEVCEIFPSPLIHIGGDEAPKNQWRKSRNVRTIKHERMLRNYEQVQSFFMQQIVEHLERKGRKAIGWGEVMKGKIGSNMVVMSWLSKSAGYKALRNGNQVIMAPRFYCYFDYPQRIRDKLHAIWMTLLPIKKVYRFEPVDEKIPDGKRQQVLGGEAAVWTEFIKDEKQLYRQVMPRLAAMSEALWSSQKNYEDFLRRLSALK